MTEIKIPNNMSWKNESLSRSEFSLNNGKSKISFGSLDLDIV
jgi:hypothetical protein